MEQPRPREASMGDRETRAERLTRNEAIFRQINDRMNDLSESLGDFFETNPYACECVELTCVEQLSLTPAEYAAIRDDPRRFLVSPSNKHVVPTIETIVAKTDRYWVVEKVGDAGRAAERAAGDD
jgi:hypothetical protein